MTYDDGEQACLQAWGAALDPRTVEGAADRLLAAACYEAALDAANVMVARNRLGEGLVAEMTHVKAKALPMYNRELA